MYYGSIYVSSYYYIVVRIYVCIYIYACIAILNTYICPIKYIYIIYALGAFGARCMGGAATQRASAAYIAILVNISTAPIPSDA